MLADESERFVIMGGSPFGAGAAGFELAMCRRRASANGLIFPLFHETRVTRDAGLSSFPRVRRDARRGLERESHEALRKDARVHRSRSRIRSAVSKAWTESHLREDVFLEIDERRDLHPTSCLLA